MVTQKENDNSPEHKHKVVKDCDLNDRIQNSSHKETQQDTKDIERQFNPLRNKINEQKEYFTKDIKTIKNN